MNELSEIIASGKWPETSLVDVYHAWERLGGLTPKYSKTILVGPKRLLNILDVLYKETTWTYASILKQNLNLDDIIRIESEDSNILLYNYDIDPEAYPEIGLCGTSVKILGVTRSRGD